MAFCLLMPPMGAIVGLCVCRFHIDGRPQGAHTGSTTSAFDLLSLLGYGLVVLLSESRPRGRTCTSET